jgi:hypothetical protein
MPSGTGISREREDEVRGDDVMADNVFGHVRQSPRYRTADFVVL